MVRFDEFWPEDETQDDAVTGDWPWPSDGKHAGEIVRVRDQEFSFMERHGANGRAFSIEVQIPKAKRVESVISVMWRGAISEVCRAARVHPPKRGEDWDPQQLVGRQVVVETVIGIAKSGKEYCRIEKWHAQAEPLPKALAEAAPPAPKKRPQPVADDDIPF
jgi:hypothetical protein